MGTMRWNRAMSYASSGEYMRTIDFLTPEQRFMLQAYFDQVMAQAGPVVPCRCSDDHRLVQYRNLKTQRIPVGSVSAIPRTSRID